MQGKGFIKFVALAFLLLSLYNLFLTWQTNRVEKKAKAHSERYVQDHYADLSETEFEQKVKTVNQNYLDSIYELPAIKLGPYKQSYKTLKASALKLGLDLQGGMSVVLEADMENLVRSLSRDSQNGKFLDAIFEAREKLQSEQKPFIDLFAESYKGSDKDFAQLFTNIDTEEELGSNPSKADVVKFLKERGNKAFQSTYDIIQSRIDGLGLSSPNIQRQDLAKRIIVEMPGVDNPERVREILVSSANLEFYEAYKGSEFLQYLITADQLVKQQLDLNDPVTATDKTKSETLGEETASEPAQTVDDGETNDSGDTTKSSLIKELEKDSLNVPDPVDLSKTNPLLVLLSLETRYDGPTMGYASEKDLEKINEYLEMDAVKAAFPQNAKLAWSHKPEELETADGTKIKKYILHALKTDANGKAAIEGDKIAKAYDDFHPQKPGDRVVNMNFTVKGASDWANLTKKVSTPEPGYIAVVLDDKVRSAPRVKEELSGGRSYIEGNFTLTEAKDLATVLNTGKLEVPAKIIEESVVGPTLGKRSINNSMKALIAGLLLVLLFMVFYYGKAGIIADIALLLNMILIFGILAATGAALTLPGIAGLVLTVGMAVDANVIIFERVREELRKGSALPKAIRDGYKASLSAIVDANITTLIIAIILFFFGIGPIKGFAIVLFIGIITSFFTGVLVTRVIKEDMLAKNKHISYWTNISKNWLSKLNFHFIDKRKIAYVVSGIVLLIALGSIFTRGFDLGVDLRSGRSYVVQFDHEVQAEDIAADLSNTFGDGVSNVVRTFGSNDQVKITTTLLADQSGLEIDKEAENQLFTALKSETGASDFEEFKANNLRSRLKVDSSIADDLRKSARILTIIALLAIFLYIFARFLKWQFGLAAVITLMHDSIILLGAFSLFKGILPFALEIDQNFIAALLMVIGYSINDTVVVFDRIREYLNLHPNKPYKEVINSAINSTLSRTLMTSLTTLLVILLLFLFGGAVIKGFAFALLLGVLVGTYSSIFVATPIVVDLYNKGRKKLETSKK